MIKSDFSIDNVAPEAHIRTRPNKSLVVLRVFLGRSILTKQNEFLP